MAWLKATAAELWGLFVEDGRYALAIVVWLGLAWLVLPLLGLGAHGRAIVFAFGLLLILLEGTRRGARAKRG